MTDLNEPADGGYAAVEHRSGVQLFLRADAVAAQFTSRPGCRWMPVSVTGLNVNNPRSWDELTQLGPVAYVGAFVDRSGVNA